MNADARSDRPRRRTVRPVPAGSVLVAAAVAWSWVRVLARRRRAARERIAEETGTRDLLDTVAQGLAGIATQLEAAEYDDDWEGRGRRARALARSGLVDARRAIAALGVAERAGGLTQAVAQACLRWSAVTGVSAVVEARGPERPSDCAGELLRICEESLANVSRHAGASRVRVGLTYTADAVRLEIVDDGRGFDPDAVSRGRGVPGMRERALRCGGALELSSGPGNGTTVRATVPLRRTPS